MQSAEPVVVLWPVEMAAYVDARGDADLCAAVGASVGCGPGAGFGTGSAWMSRDSALGAVWRRTHKPSFKAARAAWLARGQAPRRAAVSAPGGGADGACDTLETLRAALAGATDAQRLALYRDTGRSQEEHTAAMVERMLGRPLTARNAAAYCTVSDAGEVHGGSDRVRWRQACTVDHSAEVAAEPAPGPYAFSGQVDGWQEDPGLVVEIKTRMGAIAECMPVHDALQVLTYLEMTRADEAVYVQRRAHTAEMRVQRVRRDTLLWARVLAPKVRAFVCDVRRLLRGSPQDEFLRHRALSAVECLPPPLAVLADPPPTPLALAVGGGPGLASASLPAPAHVDAVWTRGDRPPLPAPDPAAVAEAVAARSRAGLTAHMPPRLGPPPALPDFLLPGR